MQADLRWGCFFTRREILETYHNSHFHRLENVNSRSSRGKATCGFLESKLASRIVGAVGRSETLKLACKFPVQNDPVESGVKMLIALFASACTLCQPAYADGLSSDSGYDSSHSGWAIFKLFHTIFTLCRICQIPSSFLSALQCFYGKALPAFQFHITISKCKWPPFNVESVSWYPL